MFVQATCPLWILYVIIVQVFYLLLKDSVKYKEYQVKHQMI